MRSMRATTSTSDDEARLHAESVRRHGRRPDSARPAFLFRGLRGTAGEPGPDDCHDVPDENARLGMLPTGSVAIDPAIQPYLDEFPRANGENLGGGLARYTFPFAQVIDQQFVQARLDAVPGSGAQLFARYTFDNADQRLPTDYPQFPRAFVSRNHFMTVEYRKVLTNATVHTARLGLQPHEHRTERGSQHVAAAAGVCARARPCSAPSTSGDFRGSARRPPRTSSSVRT